jgi:hypothetical protein
MLGGCSERVSVVKFPDNRENTGNFRWFGLQTGQALHFPIYKSAPCGQIPYATEQGIFSSYQGKIVSVHFSHTCFAARGRDLFSLSKFAEEESEMSGEHRPWQRYCEAFWRAHHEAWKNSDLNQREYCEAQGIPLKAFGNWGRSSKPSRSLLSVSCSIGVAA